MLVHVSVQDLQRNLRRNIEREDSALDRFAPGWRQHVDVGARDDVIRAAIFDHWVGLIRGLDMQPSQGIELVSGEGNQRLYWLVLVARHKRAGELWDKIRNISRQGRLFEIRRGGNYGDGNEDRVDGDDLEPGYRVHEN